MLSENKQHKLGSDRLWKRIALVSGIFAILISVLLLANYLQYKKADPINTTTISGLITRLSDNPADSTLRAEIRTLDLLTRKAYFTSQWQIKTGGYFMLIMVALFVISLQVIDYRKKINPVLSSDPADILFDQRRKARFWIVATGGLLLVTAAISAILSSNELEAKFINIASGELTSEEAQIQTLNIETTPESPAQDSYSPSVVQETTVSTPSTEQPAIVSADNFPNFRGLGGTGIVNKLDIPESWDGPSGNNIVWKTAVPLPGYSSPVIWGEKLFITGANTEKQEVYCYDANNGKLLWTVTVGKGIKRANVSDYTGYAPSTAVTDGSAVYVIFPTGDMAAIDMNGKTVWERDLGLPDNHYGHASSLLMHEDKVIVQYDQATDPRIFAVSAKTGQTVWSTARQVAPSWSSPIIVNTGRRTELIVVAEPYMSAYNPANGQELWKIEAAGGEMGPSPAYANGIAFALNDNAKLSAIKLGAQPSVLWEDHEFLSDIPSPVATDKYLFVATSYGMFVCYDALTGEKYWEQNFENNIYASPMLVNDKLYVLNFEGVMHFIKADKTYLSFGSAALGERCLATPAFTNGRIYLRGLENLYCIGK
jgi:outer membrane protein assembly factor BamB